MSDNCLIHGNPLHYDMRSGSDVCYVCQREHPFPSTSTPVAEPSITASPKPEIQEWTNAPDSCPTCDSREFISSGPRHYVCYRCLLLRENASQAQASKAMAEALERVLAAEWVKSAGLLADIYEALDLYSQITKGR